MSKLRGDLSQYYPMKAAIEELFGKAAFAKLKDSGSFAHWKREMRRLLDALELAGRVTVHVADDEWREEIADLLAVGKKQLASARTIDELFAALCATLTRLSFLQLGYLPHRSGMASVPLSPTYWQLDAIRTVQYVQSSKQKAAALRVRKSKQQ